MSSAVFQGRSLWGSTFMCSCKVSVGSWHCTVSWMVDVLSSWSYEFPSTQAMYPKMTYFWVSLIEQVTFFGNIPFRMVSAQWSFFFFNFFVFNHERQRERERQRNRQRLKQAPCREPDVGLDPKSLGSCPGPKAAPNRWATWATQPSDLVWYSLGPWEPCPFCPT